MVCLIMHRRITMQKRNLPNLLVLIFCLLGQTYGESRQSNCFYQQGMCIPKPLSFLDFLFNVQIPGNMRASGLCQTAMFVWPTSCFVLCLSQPLICAVLLSLLHHLLSGRFRFCRPGTMKTFLCVVWLQIQSSDNISSAFVSPS